MNATCTYYMSHKVVKVEILRQEDSSVELSHYEVSINDMNTNVSAQLDNPMANASGLFYPVENTPGTAQIVAVDVCGQRSSQTMISCNVDSFAITGGSLRHS